MHPSQRPSSLRPPPRVPLASTESREQAVEGRTRGGEEGDRRRSSTQGEGHGGSRDSWRMSEEAPIPLGESDESLYDSLKDSGWTRPSSIKCGGGREEGREGGREGKRKRRHEKENYVRESAETREDHTFHVLDTRQSSPLSLPSLHPSLLRSS